MKKSSSLNKTSAILGGVLFLIILLLYLFETVYYGTFHIIHIIDLKSLIEELLWYLLIIAFAVMLFLKVQKLVIIPCVLHLLYSGLLLLEYFTYPYIIRDNIILLNNLILFATTLFLFILSFFPLIKMPDTKFKPVYISFIPALLYFIATLLVLFRYSCFGGLRFVFGLWFFLLYRVSFIAAYLCVGIFVTTSSEKEENTSVPYSSPYTSPYTPSATPYGYQPTPATPSVTPTGYQPAATTEVPQPVQAPVPTQPIYNKPENFSLTEELSKAKALFDSGSISEQEYANLKNQIINS